MNKNFLLLAALTFSTNLFAALPDFYVEKTNFNQVKLSEVWKTIYKNAPVNVVVDPKVDFILTVNNLSGYSTDILNEITKEANLTYHYSGNNLYIEGKDSPKDSLVNTSQDIVNKDGAKQAPMVTTSAIDKPATATKNKESLSNKLTNNSKKTTPRKITFSQRKHNLASYSLKKYVESKGYKLYWNASHQIEIDEDVNYFGSFDQNVNVFLSKLNLTGWIVDSQRTVYVK